MPTLKIFCEGNSRLSSRAATTGRRGSENGPRWFKRPGRRTEAVCGQRTEGLEPLIPGTPTKRRIEKQDARLVQVVAQAVVDASEEALLLSDDKGRILGATSQFHALVGYPPTRRQAARFWRLVR